MKKNIKSIALSIILLAFSNIALADNNTSKKQATAQQQAKATAAAKKKAAQQKAKAAAAAKKKAAQQKAKAAAAAKKKAEQQKAKATAAAKKKAEQQKKDAAQPTRAEAIAAANQQVFSTSGTKVVSCSSKSTASLDYGNASDQESSACHDTDKWQRLGDSSNTDTPDTQETNASTNDGVSWKTSSDGGTTWTENGDLVEGDLIVFEFDVTRLTTGNHKYDLLKSWVDWNQDGIWTEDEDIIEHKWWKNVDSEGNIATSGNKNNDLSTWENLGTDGSLNSGGNEWQGSSWKDDIFNSTDTTGTFFSEQITIPVLSILEDIWLRARVVCENSLEDYADNMNLISIGYQHQGEVEDYQLTVAKKSIKVPEPSTLAIFALGLLGLTARRKVISK